MKRNWTTEELVEDWTLLPNELALLENKTAPRDWASLCRHFGSSQLISCLWTLNGFPEIHEQLVDTVHTADMSFHLSLPTPSSSILNQFLFDPAPTAQPRGISEAW